MSETFSGDQVPPQPYFEYDDVLKVYRYITYEWDARSGVYRQITRTSMARNYDNPQQALDNLQFRQIIAGGQSPAQAVSYLQTARREGIPVSGGTTEVSLPSYQEEQATTYHTQQAAAVDTTVPAGQTADEVTTTVADDKKKTNGGSAVTTQTDDQIRAFVQRLQVEPIADPEKARRILAYMAQYKISRERLASALGLTLQQVNTIIANLQARGGTVVGTAEPQAGNTGLIVAALVGAFLLLS